MSVPEEHQLTKLLRVGVEILRCLRVPGLCLEVWQLLGKLLPPA